MISVIDTLGDSGEQLSLTYCGAHGVTGGWHNVTTEQQNTAFQMKALV